MIPLSANALTTVERLQLLIPDADGALAQDKLALLVNRASAQIEAALERKLGRATYTEPVTPSGGQRLLLKQWPILAVERVTQDGAVLPPTSYSIEEGGSLYKDDGWRWTGYPQGLAYDPWGVKRDITVVYTAGYVLPKDANEAEPCTLPADLEGLCMEMAQAAWGKLQTGGYGGLTSFGISDVRWDWATDAPAAWQDTLDRYRRWA